MFDTWLKVLDRVLSPERAALERCERERTRHLAERLASRERRTDALLRCEDRINQARHAVFAADDGVVGAHMTELERQWRLLSRADPDAGLMDLWARLVSAESIDRKRFRDEAPAARLDALVALAADEPNVLAAEAALAALRVSAARHAIHLPARVAWRFGANDEAFARPLLREAARLAYERCPGDYRSIALERATELELRVQARALVRFPGRPELACDLGYAAFVDSAWRAAELDPTANPVAPLLALWKTGYAVSSLSPSAIVLEIPALPAPRDGAPGALHSAPARAEARL